MKRILGSALVAVSLFGAIAAPDVANARNGRNGALAAGAAVGVVGGALLGSTLSNNNNRRDYYDEAPPPRYVNGNCFWQRQRVWDGEEYQMQRVRVCQR